MHSLYKTLILPRSIEPDAQNRELVLNWLLVGSLSLTLVAFLSTLGAFLVLHDPQLLVRLIIFGGVMTGFACLLAWSRQRQQPTLLSVVLVGIFFVAATVVMYRWDIDNPIGILLFSVAIVMAGIVLNARFSLYVAMLTILALSIYTHGKVHGYWSPDLSWMNRPSRPMDIFGLASIFAILTLVSWLSNWQTEQALIRARRSEKALKRRRDLLEIKVEQRTRALQAAQFEQIQQVYRFAELGHLSTALFHDLANHVMSVSIDIEGLQKRSSSDILARIQDNVRHIDTVVQRVQRQIRGQGEVERFEVNREIGEVIKMLAYFSNKVRVSVELSATPSGQKLITYRGDLTRFRQIIVNLLSNAIEAYPAPERTARQRTVLVTVAKKSHYLVITITDHGKGISPAKQAKIFEPFYSTKDKGMGIGLFIVKKVIEEDFGGTISVTSNRPAGTMFVVTLPLSLQKRPLLS